MRAIIVDDEYLARKRLETLLEDVEDISIIGDSKGGQEAIDLIDHKKPDLIFLDVQMPKLDGFSLLSKLKDMPMVIFTTAYDKYALNAFDVEAVDYLLKPFDEDRLYKSLDRVRNQFKLNRSAQFEEKLNRLVKSYQAELSPFLEKISIKERGRYFEVLLEDVHYLEADGNYVKLHTAQKTFMYREKMKVLEASLNPRIFIRAHKSYIVNTDQIVNCKYLGNNQFEINLKDGKNIISGRVFKSNIEAHLNL